MESQNTIRVSIGSEPQQYIPAEVLKSSIRRRTTRPVIFTESWNPKQGWHRLLTKAPDLKNGTAFSGWRWLVPKLYEHQGKAIYLDADQVVLGDIAEIWDFLKAEEPKEPDVSGVGGFKGTCFAAVCDAVGFFGDKKPEPNHVQTSVMVMNCKECDWDAAVLFETVAHGNYKYRDLMQAKFCNREWIQELPPEWNHFGICTPETKLLHWSHVASQPYRNTDHPTAHVFRAELASAIQAGHIDPRDVRKEVKRGHLHKAYLGVAQDSARIPAEQVSKGLRGIQ